MSSPVAWKRVARPVWSFFAPRYTAGTLAPAATSAAVSTVVVIVCCILFTPQIGLIGLLGAMAPYWETGRPFWARVRHGLVVAVGLTTSMAVGVLIAPFHWAIVPMSVLVILVVGMLYYTFMLTRGPSPVMMFYAAVVGSFFGADATQGWKMVGVTAFASVLASALLLVPLAFSPRGPEQRAMVTARMAVAAYLDAPTDDDAAARSARDSATEALNVAWLTLRSAWPATTGDRYRRIRDELTDTTDDWMSIISERSGLQSDPHVSADRERLMFKRPSVRYLVRRAFSRNSLEWFTTWRMALAAGVAGVLSELCGIGHPYWAMITATIIINQWMDRATATRRAAHRTVGTLIGVGIVGIVAFFDPSPWPAVAIVIVCIVGQYVAFPLNYSLALMFITPMALITIEASSGGMAYASLISDRFIDTVIGSLTALAVTYATSYHFPRRLVRTQSARAQQSIDVYETLHHNGMVDPGDNAGVELKHELIRHMSVLGRAVADDPRLADLAPMEHRVADRGYVALCPVPESGHARSVN